MSKLGSIITFVLGLLLCGHSSPVGKNYCYFGNLMFAVTEEFRLSFVNATHMTFSFTSYFGSESGSKRNVKSMRGPVVPGIPYQYNSTSGIIDADVGSSSSSRAKELRAYRWYPFINHVKAEDFRRMEYNSSVDEVKMKVKRGPVISRRRARTFRRC
ncbi:hypothetical protein FOZ61_001670 [Perkinsus olseni]|uniref:Uncharacterized protein n=1 Tax=Perkinsus olseni TaxID=32597 RepID=A0A7J6KRE0_PEROL|nr:hypothetical protein FOZ61_001670 [Perkinsus olseni]KAF4650096.1 hypothetical protein FOL46_001207 [Perkinsus olseni]